MIRNDDELRVLLLEDTLSAATLITQVLEKNFDNVNVLHDNRAELAFTSIPLFRPHIIISDYSFPTSTCKIIMCQLKKFKGLVIIYSKSSVEDIKNCIDDIPDDIIIINKPNTWDVVSAIKEHIN